MCYGYSKDFGRSYKKETDRRPEARQETPVESPEPQVKPQAKAQDYTFWAFPAWRRTPKPHTPAAERSKESV
ncbi:hypothetical protein ACFYLX_08210 [Pseudarthrobacter enclensis]|jgi:hypothetical protein|uniref:hypothetical protein n=1 Tax=Pseudarthrobacter enclensis TaxID=993070 RepID=UPI003699FCD9